MNIVDEFIDETNLNMLFTNTMYREIISTKTFRRLKDISFLGAIDYLSKNKKRHNRYNHSISVGTLALYYSRKKQLNQYETNHLVIASLLHDIGHGPLSHSMEQAFYEKYGISHHSITNDIIKGKSKNGTELYQLLKKYNIDIDYIVALLDGDVSNQTSFALNNPINIDTADGIIRSISYAYSSKTKKTHLALLPKPIDIIEALVNKNKKVLDSFWNLKHRVYSSVIHKPENLKADIVALNFAKENSAISQDDFYETDKSFKYKYSSMFHKLKSEKIDTVQYKKRFYFLDTCQVKIIGDEDIYDIYKSKRELKSINLCSHKVPRHQASLF